MLPLDEIEILEFCCGYERKQSLVPRDLLWLTMSDYQRKITSIPQKV